MHPIVFEIPGLGLPIRSFGLMVRRRVLARDVDHEPARAAPRRGSDAELAKYSTVQVWVLVGVILGARRCT